MDFTNCTISRPRRRATRIVFATGVVFALGGLGAALATPPAGNVSRTEVAVGRLTEPLSMQTAGPQDFRIQQVTIDPGGDSGWHTHPGYEYTIVKAGEVVFEKAGACTPRTVKAGDAIFISGSLRHRAHNAGTVPAELWVTYTLAPDHPVRIDSDNACGGQ